MPCHVQRLIKCPDENHVEPFIGIYKSFRARWLQNKENICKIIWISLIEFTYFKLTKYWLNLAWSFQIQRLVQDNISTDEIRGMFIMKKADLERDLIDALQKIRLIESRLTQLDQSSEPDVIVKSIPVQAVLSMRTQVMSTEEAMAIFSQIITMLPPKAGSTFASLD